MSWTAPPSPPRGHRAHPAAVLRKARLRRRTWWFVGTLPVVVALLVIGFKLAFLAPIASFAKSDYDDGAYGDAAGTYGAQRTLNLVEPWKAHYNTGTADAAAGDSWTLYEAIRSLDRAYELAEDETPEERCMIQTNLSLAYELSGDQDMAYADRKTAELEAVQEALAARDAGLPYDEAVLDPYGDGTEPDPDVLRQDAKDWYQYAEQSYATAEQVRGWPDCGESEQTPEQQEQSEAAQDRLEDKQQQAKDAQEENEGGAGGDSEGEGSEGDEQNEASGGDGSEGSESDQQSEAEREEQQRQERLEEQNSDARDEADREEQEYRDLYGDEPGGGTDGGDGGGGSTKNW